MGTIFIEKAFRKIRSVGTFWIAEQTLNYLESIRTYELDVVLNMLPSEGNLLEIGAGTGWQAKALQKRGYNVCAIDLLSSNYSDNRICPITEYDGKNIPYEDSSFDIIFSSNVLEHIPHIYEFQKEILRVLKPDGYVVHVLPSSTWRLWTQRYASSEMLDHTECSWGTCRKFINGNLLFQPSMVGSAVS